MNSSRGKRKYQPIRESAAVFDAYLAKMRQRGELILPPERALCDLIGCSRGGLRALLTKKLGEGAILKTGKSRSLSLQTATRGKVYGRLAFVALGHLSPGNPAWNKLWCRLSQRAPAAGIAAELLLIPYEIDGFDWEAALADLPRLVVLTTLPKAHRQPFLRLKGKVLVTTESHDAGSFAHMVALDNRAVGRRAAAMLKGHGYARPAMICERLMVEGRPYSQFEERIAGFREACRELGLAFPERALSRVEGRGARLKIDIAQKAKDFALGGFDSIFLHTDNDLDFLVEGLRLAGKSAPEDLGVVTVNSFDTARSRHPEVSSVAHGTDPMAALLLEKARRLYAGDELAFGKTLVEPGIHEGKTLRAAHTAPRSRGAAAMSPTIR
ncbi:MAG: LacI family DNA-binding transcriptional regulator [Spirochaetes bacterium]|nr:LacI family DNA-binding transcriptional regulator [Spirochaetota bacterium]